MAGQVTRTRLLTAPTQADALFVGDYDTGDFSQWPVVQNVFWNGDGEDYPGGYSVAIVSGAAAREGAHAARFEIRDGDNPIPPAGTERSEVQGALPLTGGTEGDDRWYKWSTKFDTQFQDDIRTQGGFCLVAQWHADAEGSPPVGLFCDDVDGEMCIRIHKQSSPGVIIDNIIPWSAALNKGNWHDFKWHIKWSTSDVTGFIEFWHNDVYEGLLNVRTLVPDGGGTYFKQGIYRDAGIDGTAVVFHDGFVTATTEAGLG